MISGQKNTDHILGMMTLGKGDTIREQDMGGDLMEGLN